MANEVVEKKRRNSKKSTPPDPTSATWLGLIQAPEWDWRFGSPDREWFKSAWLKDGLDREYLEITDVEIQKRILYEAKGRLVYWRSNRNVVLHGDEKRNLEQLEYFVRDLVDRELILRHSKDLLTPYQQSRLTMDDAHIEAGTGPKGRELTQEEINCFLRRRPAGALVPFIRPNRYTRCGGKSGNYPGIDETSLDRDKYSADCAIQHEKRGLIKKVLMTKQPTEWPKWLKPIAVPLTEFPAGRQIFRQNYDSVEFVSKAKSISDRKKMADTASYPANKGAVERSCGNEMSFQQARKKDSIPNKVNADGNEIFLFHRSCPCMSMPEAKIFFANQYATSFKLVLQLVDLLRKYVNVEGCQNRDCWVSLGLFAAKEYRPGCGSCELWLWESLSRHWKRKMRVAVDEIIDSSKIVTLNKPAAQYKWDALEYNEANFRVVWKALLELFVEGAEGISWPTPAHPTWMRGLQGPNRRFPLEKMETVTLWISRGILESKAEGLIGCVRYSVAQEIQRQVHVVLAAPNVIVREDLPASQVGHPVIHPPGAQLYAIRKYLIEDPPPYFARAGTDEESDGSFRNKDSMYSPEVQVALEKRMPKNNVVSQHNTTYSGSNTPQTGSLALSDEPESASASPTPGESLIGIKLMDCRQGALQSYLDTKLIFPLAGSGTNNHSQELKKVLEKYHHIQIKGEIRQQGNRELTNSYQVIIIDMGCLGDYSFAPREHSKGYPDSATFQPRFMGPNTNVFQDRVPDGQKFSILEPADMLSYLGKVKRWVEELASIEEGTEFSTLSIFVIFGFGLGNEKQLPELPDDVNKVWESLKAGLIRWLAGPRDNKNLTTFYFPTPGEFCFTRVQPQSARHAVPRANLVDSLCGRFYNEHFNIPEIINYYPTAIPYFLKDRLNNLDCFEVRVHRDRDDGEERQCLVFTRKFIENFSANLYITIQAIAVKRYGFFGTSN